MANIFGSMNALEACVAVAVSESKKTVSATAAAVVSISLLTAPIQQSQSGILVVSEVILTDCDMTTSSEFDMEVVPSDGSGVWSEIWYC